MNPVERELQFCISELDRKHLWHHIDLSMVSWKQPIVFALLAVLEV